MTRDKTWIKCAVIESDSQAKTGACAATNEKCATVAQQITATTASALSALVIAPIVALDDGRLIAFLSLNDDATLLRVSS